METYYQYLLLLILAKNKPLNNICFALVLFVMALYELLRRTE